MCLLLILCFLPLSDSVARRTHVSPEQHRQLSSINTVLVSTGLVPPKDLETPTVIQNVVTKRLREIGLSVVLEVTEPHDAEIRVTCEEEKKETATTRYVEMPNWPLPLIDYGMERRVSWAIA